MSMSTPRQYCSFYLDGLLFGIESQRIQEVIRSLELTDVPLAPPSVSGLMNLRGQIVVAIDLRSRLRLPARAAGVSPMCVVAHTPDGSVSLLVDDIGDVVERAHLPFRGQRLTPKIRRAQESCTYEVEESLTVRQKDPAFRQRRCRETVVGRAFPARSSCRHDRKSRRNRQRYRVAAVIEMFATHRRKQFRSATDGEGLWGACNRATADTRHSPANT